MLEAPRTAEWRLPKAQRKVVNALQKTFLLLLTATPVLLFTPSGEEGYNLHFCHMIINYDLPWNPMQIEQRIG